MSEIISSLNLHKYKLSPKARMMLNINIDHYEMLKRKHDRIVIGDKEKLVSEMDEVLNNINFILIKDSLS